MERLPLEGVRIIDFCWIGAGSYTTKVLADMGADVIKIESVTRLDSLRLGAPYKDGKRGVNRSGYFADRNTSKRSITIAMKHPSALKLIEKLIRQADIITNNFTPGVMEKFGLGYPEVRAMKSDIIYLSMSMHGSDGPERNYLGYGANIAAITGIQYLTGLPDRTPAGTGTNYPDHIPNPCHAAFAVLAALRHRRRTGNGQYIEVAQSEPTVAMLGPTVLDLTVNGRNHQRTGNKHAWAAPHGVYPCLGSDRWIAIAVMNDAQWAALIKVLGSPPWALEERWAGIAARYRDAADLDRLLAKETAVWNAEELMRTLQEKNVSAGVVQNAEDVVKNDPQLSHRGHWVKLKHAEMGETIYNMPPFRFSRSPVQLRSPAPLLGEHTREICSSLLGLNNAEIDALIASEVRKIGHDSARTCAVRRKLLGDQMSVQFSVENHIATIVINRPEAMNSIDPETRQELLQLWERLRIDEEIWVAIITGAGEKAFCAGADLKKTMPTDESFAEQFFSKPGSGALAGSLDTDKPLIAAINGYAMGGGMELALACDIRVASENAQFALSEVRRGSIPGSGGTQRLPRAVGLSDAMLMLLTGDRIDAKEAFRIGLVSKVVPPTQLMSTALEIANKIASNAPLSVRAIKRLVRRGMDMPVSHAMEVERYAFGLLYNSEDRIEGRKAFAEKRKPNYKGR